MANHDNAAMTWQEALEIVVARTKAQPFRAACADDQPNAAKREACRKAVIRMAAGESGQSYPSRQEMVGNLFRSALGWARSGFKIAPREVRRERLATCEPCEKWDSIRKACRVCGCKTSAKVYVLSDKCPLNLWKQ
jgi:hypothetical protein